MVHLYRVVFQQITDCLMYILSDVNDPNISGHCFIPIVSYLTNVKFLAKRITMNEFNEWNEINYPYLEKDCAI